MRIFFLTVFMALACSASADTDAEDGYQVQGTVATDEDGLRASLVLTSPNGGAMCMPSITGEPGTFAELLFADPNGQYTVDFRIKLRADGSGCVAYGSLVDAEGVTHPLYLDLAIENVQEQ